MTTEHTSTGLIGASIRRVEDGPLITGKGCYVEDIELPGMFHMTFLRSPYPHAKIISIDTSATKAMSGVIAVVTGADLSAELHVPAFPMVPGMKIPSHPLLARRAVHAVGTPVAVVVAQSRTLVQDAASAIDVEYEALPSVVAGSPRYRSHRHALYRTQTLGSDTECRAKVKAALFRRESDLITVINFQVSGVSKKTANEERMYWLAPCATLFALCATAQDFLRRLN